jgi:hypothetical protein
MQINGLLNCKIINLNISFVSPYGPIFKHLKKSGHYNFFALILIHKRLGVCAYGYRGSILFRHPRTTGTSYFLLKPFTKTVWLCILLSWALMMATIHLVKWLEYRHQRDGHQSSKPDYDHSWDATILTIFGAISEQGNIFTGNSYVFKHSPGCRSI